MPPPGSKKQRQEMSNFEDLQYFAHVTVGNQTITGIIDTGSFELVVFDTSCLECGAAAKYSANSSLTYSKASVGQGLFYGSGSVYTWQAYDLVSLGPFAATNLTFWDVYRSFMPVLRNARFQSIIGVGPPETPGADAWQEVKRAVTSMRSDVSQGYMPSSYKSERIKESLDLSVVLSSTRKLVQALNVTTFSVCLGYTPGSSGYFIWDDHSAAESPSLFSRVPVMGKHTWTVNLSNVALAPAGNSSFDIGCTSGCGAIVDSGTSLLLMPVNAVEQLMTALDQLQVDCSDMNSLPDLSFSLGGHHFTLPPDAYVASVEQEEEAAAAQVPSLFRVRRLGNCQLAVMESYSETSWGPLWILGMPFFRKYYTSFHIGSSRRERALLVARASPECKPEPMVSRLARTPHEIPRRTYKLSNMFMPANVRKAATEAFLEL